MDAELWKNTSLIYIYIYGGGGVFVCFEFFGGFFVMRLFFDD